MGLADDIASPRGDDDSVPRLRSVSISLDTAGDSVYLPPVATSDLDSGVRAAAFEFLEEQTRLHGEVLPREILSRGFVFNVTRVPLVGPQGIFKPAMTEMPLTITTAPIVEGRERPYEDRVEEGGAILYRYRGTDPRHLDNAGLRLAMQRQGIGVPRRSVLQPNREFLAERYEWFKKAV